MGLEKSLYYLSQPSIWRSNLAASKSYFIGGNPDYSEDTGFDLQPWIHVRFENEGIIEGESNAIALGNYYFTSHEEEKVKVEYTFGYYRSEDGTLKINLHHSSILFKTELV